MKRNILRLLWHAYVVVTGFVLGLLLMALTTSLLTSCRTVSTHEVSSHYAAHVDTIRLVQLQRDSIYLHDSIFTSLVTKGDTVFITKFRDRLHYSAALRRDTIYRTQTDTVRVVETKTQTVTKTAPTKPRPLLIIAAWLLLLATAAYIAFRLYKILRKSPNNPI